LLGAQIWGVAERLERLVQSSGFYPCCSSVWSPTIQPAEAWNVSGVTAWGKSIFVNRLASLVRRALNEEQQGREVAAHS